MKVVIVGSGNTATILGRLILDSGHTIVQVISRNEAQGRQLAMILNATWGTINQSTFQEADLYILALSDNALHEANRIKALQGKWVVHTAGSVSMEVLAPLTDLYGVLYPLQTLSRFTQHIPQIPLLVNGNTKNTQNNITQFAQSLSSQVTLVPDNQRLQYHIAAVFVSNFVNHLMALTENYCQKENLNFNYLLPLMNEVVLKIQQYGALNAQTGPAVRGDDMTMNMHLNELSNYPSLADLYQKLSKGIQDFHAEQFPK